jgi:23S rRNA (cytosine1962-C5)-methyltransferase
LTEQAVGQVRLKPKKNFKLRNGYLWVHAVHVGKVKPPEEAGGLVDIVDERGRFLARGYYNDASRIPARVLAWDKCAIDLAFFRSRIQRAWEYRQRHLEDTRACRVVFGESDGLPGLVVDRFEDVLVVQIQTLGMERFRDLIVEALISVLEPTGIYERSQGASRRLEGMEERTGPLLGDPPGLVPINHGGLRMEVDVAGGQKTGLFLDQRLNHLAMRRFAPDARVLDVFCHTASFGLHAAAAGARTVVAIDQSRDALEVAESCAVANGLESLCDFVEGNAFDVLRSIEEQFDLVVVDPPAFARNRASLEGALRGYKEVNLRAMKRVSPGGVLVSCSCSYHMNRDRFTSMLVSAARDAGRPLKVIEERSQSPDHPVLLAHPETSYLKCFVLQVE